MSNADNTPTPRTDAEASDGWSGDAICVSASFARELERENIILLEQIDELIRDKRRMDWMGIDRDAVDEEMDKQAYEQ